MAKLLLLDGHSLAFRAFYALPAANFSTVGGQHTNAVYGFLGMFLTLMDKEQPTHVAAAFDLSGPTFREESFPEYKAQRPSTPEEFKGQIELIRRTLEALGVTTLDKESYEADDIIATLATAGAKDGMDVLICTGDRDSLQLVTEDVTVLYTLKGVSELHRFTPQAVEEKYGVTPTQYPDLAALRGDTSDNMPGVPGVGPKTAQKWIAKYGSLQGVIDNMDDIGGKVGANLRENIDNVVLARDITEMVRDLKLVDDLDALSPRDIDPNEALGMFEELQFGTGLRNRAFKIMGVEFADSAAIPVTVEELKPGKLGAWLKKRTRGTVVDVNGEQLTLLDRDNVAIVQDLADVDPKDEKVLAEWLANPQATKWLHDSKQTYHTLQDQGLKLDGVEHDTSLAAYLLRPDVRTLGLADVVQRHVGHELSENATGPERAQAVAELVRALTPEIEAAGQAELYFDLEVPLALILAAMEHAGIAVDDAALQELSDDYGARLNEEIAAARELAGEPELNLSSPKQLQKVLFETFDLPKTKKTKTGYSTAAAELEKLAAQSNHPFLGHLMAHREYQKMKSTIDGLIEAVGDDGRIHTTFNQKGAATGRLSSSDPNLQNIPVRTDAGRKIRAAFTVGEGYETLLTADYSQIEMRVMAHLSEDAGLIEAYASGEDLHNYVGSRVFDVPVDEVTPELRRRVKALSYGLVYGLSAFGLSQQLKISAGEAKRIMDNYFERFGGVKRYLDHVVEVAKETGYTETLYGRRRYLPELNSSNRVARENAERAALNAPIQGTAADIIKLAMLRVDREITRQQLASRVLLQVHDELVVEVAPGELEQITELVEREMDAAAQLRVPLDVSAGTGDSWDLAAH
ncbi:DNA polymerase I [Corynebacterium jeikeium]|uniref:DNA polymerase I n=1 Tax=Corynebacterium jeikeium TaxID=38289 RepID=UPI0001B717E1|nr:DNA polymerase I [Corynebacterium jeikeium]EEW17095.1 DNA-directed DNA polymerase [Corynebacterium jeikeium ATCC 43734]OOD30492.1 DNA polymerase I [Corynebacterium jeikeium]WCZ53385.1 DNA polymerase I [Corynebacterium jeikeium]SUY81304.1 DNA polymerase I [Corynebacterium jeikeium]